MLGSALLLMTVYPVSLKFIIRPDVSKLVAIDLDDCFVSSTSCL